MNEATVTVPADDLVLPFAVRPLGVRGRVVRLGAVVNDIVHRHDYPPAVSALLAEAIALTAMLGASLKFEGKFIVQALTGGAVNMLVADFATPGQVRGYAQYDADKVAGLETAGTIAPADLFGTGHLAMTIDQGEHMERYQGIVALGEDSLSDAAHRYFHQSEQIPTRLKLVSGPLMARGAAIADSWRAGAIMVQHLPDDGGISPIKGSSGDVPPAKEHEVSEHEVIEDDNWVKARVLLDTVEDHELLDPLLAPEELLYRLYHEDGVTVFPVIAINDQCSCSRVRIQTVLSGFSQEERTGITEEGKITVTCEFCSTKYAFEPDEIEEAG